ncbi:MAG: DNA polymerase III subunit delta [Anaerolineae bacterium]|nr:MAG: DNA polymerase III subunit delta [Anaerolineae bacterium]
MSTPSVYILHGDDHYALQQDVQRLQERLDTQGMADLNTTRLDGRSASLQDLRNASGALPFLADRRLVVLTHPLDGVKTPSQRKTFLGVLERIPETTALVLWFDEPLADTGLNWRAHRRKTPKKDHWLIAWARQHSERTYIKGALLPAGEAMARWIQAFIREKGGSIAPDAADMLASLVGSDTRAAANECEKLLAYVNYARPIEMDDVDLLAVSNTSANVFDMVDALGARQGRKALRLLNQLLEEQAPLLVFGMIVRQFRLLLLAREVLDDGGQVNDVAAQVGMPMFVARKITPQAGRFTLEALETIYHRLLDVDEAIKSGEIEAETALNVLTAALSQ